MTKIIIATRNAHKVQEIQAILGTSFDCVGLTDYPTAPIVVEDAATFAGNAARKATQIAGWIAAKPTSESGVAQADCFVLADDSGLEVDALNGAPGVHSARFAAHDSRGEGNSPDAANNAKLLRELAAVPDAQRSASFRCVLALTPLKIHAQTPEAGTSPTNFFDGTCPGRIARAPAGQGGFGYDPLFIPDGFTISFAELGEETKNQVSHRARALAKLKEWFAARSAKATGS